MKPMMSFIFRQIDVIPTLNAPTVLGSITYITCMTQPQSEPSSGSEKANLLVLSMECISSAYFIYCCLCFCLQLYCNTGLLDSSTRQMDDIIKHQVTIWT
jgi:hypothetical protein